MWIQSPRVTGCCLRQVEALQEVLEKLGSRELPAVEKRLSWVPLVRQGWGVVGAQPWVLRLALELDPLGAGHGGSSPGGVWAGRAPGLMGACPAVRAWGPLRGAEGGTHREALQLPPRHRLQLVHPQVLLRDRGHRGHHQPPGCCWPRLGPMRWRGSRGPPAPSPHRDVPGCACTAPLGALARGAVGVQGQSHIKRLGFTPAACSLGDSGGASTLLLLGTGPGVLGGVGSHPAAGLCGASKAGVGCVVGEQEGEDIAGVGWGPRAGPGGGSCGHGPGYS